MTPTRRTITITLTTRELHALDHAVALAEATWEDADNFGSTAGLYPPLDRLHARIRDAWAARQRPRHMT